MFIFIIFVLGIVQILALMLLFAACRAASPQDAAVPIVVSDFEHHHNSRRHRLSRF